MASLEELDDLERRDQDDKKDDDKDKKPHQNGDADMKDADADNKEEEDVFDEDILHSTTRDIVNRRKLLETDLRVMKSEFSRLSHEKSAMNEKIKDNVDKIENNRYSTYLFHS